MEEAKYESGLIQLPGFQPKKRAKFDKQRQAFAAQAERNQRQQSDTIRANTAVDAANARQAGEDVEALAKFSTSLTERLIEGQKKRNEEEKQRGMMDVYENGMDTTQYDADVASLRETDNITENTAAQLEKSGTDPFVAERIRAASGWRAYGQVIAKAQLGASNYSSFLEASKPDTVVTVIDENGEKKTLTFQNATKPEEFAALQAEIRSNYIKQYSDINPAVLNEYLFPGMRTADAAAATLWSRERAKINKDERQQEAIAGFSNGSRSIGETYTILTNAGMSASDARKSLITLAADMYVNGEITEEQYEQIKANPYGPGGTWGSTNGGDFDTAEEAARTNNVQSQNLIDKERQQAHDAEAAELLTMLQEGNRSQDQVKLLLEALKQKYRNVKEYAPLKDFYDNSTVEGRSQEEQVATLDSLFRSGELTVRELQSGKYQNLDTATYQTWMSLARQSEQLGARSNESTAAATSVQPAVKAAIKDAIGRPIAGAFVDPSAYLAEVAAISELNTRAKQIRIAENVTWSEAYTRAGKELVAEIKAGSTDENSDWFVDGKTNATYNFPKFKSGANTTQEAQQTINGWKTTVDSEGRQSFSSQTIFTEDDAKTLSNPNKRGNSSADLKLRTMIEQFNSGDERITYLEARQMVLDSYGLKTERPFAPDELEITALDQDMLSRLYSPYASGPNSVAVQANRAPLVIRTGVQGGRDVIQASVAFGAPPQLAPLAAAVMANETGWGRYTSGKNNLFNIKSTDGTGTETTTREGDINGSGPSTTEQAQWRDYESGTESVKDFWDFLRSNERYAAVLTAATPMEALKELKAAGYATSPSYVEDVAATWEAMGIDPNRAFQPRQYSSSPWGNTSVISPNAQPIVARKVTVNAARNSTGMDTSAGPDTGNQACVWAVNAVLQQAGIQPPWGESVYVPDVKDNLDRTGTRLSGPIPGAIAIMQDNGTPPYPHIGIVQEDGTIISNSSSRARFDWVATASEYESKYGKKNLYYSLS